MLIPGYEFIKTITNSIQKSNDSAQSIKPVLARFDDRLIPALEVERGDSIVVIFIPSAPNAYSGSVAYLTPDRLESLDTDFMGITTSMKRFGIGSSEFIDEQNLKNILAKMN